MSKEAKLELDGKVYALPTVEGSEGEKAVDVSSLRANTGHITLDEGYGNTGSCVSKITFIDGEKGILRYRGIPIEELAEKSSFIETAYLVIYGNLPNHAQLRRFSDLLTENQYLHEDMKFHFEGFPAGAHPMAILSAMINAASCFDEQLMRWQWSKSKEFDVCVAKLISQVRTIAAYSYRKSLGLPMIYPKKAYKYTANFLHMLFSMPYEDYELKPEVVKALDLIFPAARRSRAELLHLNRAHGGIEPGESFCQRGRRRVRVVGAVARRREPGGDRDARGDSQLRRRRLEVHRGGEGQGQRQAAHGLRPPRL